MYNKLLIYTAILISACSPQSEKIKSTDIISNNNVLKEYDSRKDKSLLTNHLVNFSYSNYPREREIALKHIKSNILNNDPKEIVSADHLGIDLYDLDNDGVKEILIYLNHPSYCGSAGCRLYILKTIQNNFNNIAESVYKFVSWSDDTTIDHNAVYTGDKIKILKSKTNSVYDILLPQPKGDTIWNWQNGVYIKQ